MKIEKHTQYLGIGLTLLLILVVWMAPSHRKVVEETNPAQVTEVQKLAHDYAYYMETLKADRATIPGLPSEEAMEKVLASGDTTKLLVKYHEIRKAYAAFAIKQEEAGNFAVAKETNLKYSFFAYLTGILYYVPFDDRTTACEYFTSAAQNDPENPLYAPLEKACTAKPQ